MNTKELDRLINDDQVAGIPGPRLWRKLQIAERKARLSNDMCDYYKKQIDTLNQRISELRMKNDPVVRLMYALRISGKADDYSFDKLLDEVREEAVRMYLESCDASK